MTSSYHKKHTRARTHAHTRARTHTHTYQIYSPTMSSQFLDVGNLKIKSVKNKQLHSNSNHQWWKLWSACSPILAGTGSARTKSSYATSLNATKMYAELCTIFPKVYSWWHIWNCSQLRHFDVFFCTLHKVIQDHSICKLNWLLRNWLFSKTKEENKYSTLHRKFRNTKIKCIHKHGNGVFILYWNYTAR